ALAAGGRRKGIEEADRDRQQEEIDERSAEYEEDRRRDQIRPEGIALIAVETRGDETIDLNGNKREKHEEGADNPDPEFDDEEAKEMRRDHRYILLGSPFERQ